MIKVKTHNEPSKKESQDCEINEKETENFKNTSS
jgi:hypothetical protein